MSTVADRYAVERVLGEGGMGLVFLVRDPLRGGQKLALKQIRAERLTHSVRAAMTREFGVLIRLRHPNLVEVYDFALDPDCWFTMEYIEGLDLRAAALDGDDLIAATVQVCRALEYVHSRGLVHLDVKPSNILVGRPRGELTVKLMDFGVASDPYAGAPSGYTLGFVAPEVLEGRSFDGRADLYSLGMTLVALGSAPHAPSSDVTVQVRGLEQGIEPPQPVDTSHLPPALAAVVARLTRFDPGERFGSASQVIEALAAATGRGYELETAATRAGHLASARLFGRDAELGKLLALYAAARAGAGRQWVITGPAGVGKSRLVKELRVHAQLDGAAVASAAGAREAPTHQAIAALAAQLAAAESRLEPHHVVALERLAQTAEPGVVGERDDAGDGELESDAARSRLTEAFIALVAATARARPVVLLVEDADLVDEASAAMLLALRARVAAGELGGVLLVVSARDPGPFADPETLRLEPLPAAGVRAIVDDVLGEAGAPEALHQRLLACSRGNGFFLTELLKLLGDRGVLVRRAPGGWPGWTCDAAALAAATLPATAAAAVAERIGLLPPPLRRTMWLAALLGTRFDPTIVEAASDAGAAAGCPRAWLDDLVGRLFLVADGRHFRFAHADVRDAALADARAGGEAGALAGRVAETLARAGGHPADVARLYLESDAPARALPHLEAAAALAEAVYDHAAAVAHHDTALALAPSRAVHLRRLAAIRAGGLGHADPRADEALAAAAGDARAEAETRLELARIDARRGRFAAAIAHAGAARDRAALLGDRRAGERARAEAHRVAGLARLSHGQLVAARAELDAAVAAYAGLSDESGHAAALNDRGFVHGYAGDYAAALADHQSALANLRRLPPGVALDALAATQNNLGFASWSLGRYDAARAHLDEALALRRRLADRHGEGVTRNNIGNVLRHQGDLDGASREYEEAVALCRRSGNVLYEAVALNNLGQIAEERGDLEGAAELYRRALALVVRIGDRIREGDNLGSLGGCLLRSGHPAEAAELLRRAVALRRDIGDRAYMVLDLAELALVELALGAQAAARAAFEEAVAVLDAGQEGTEQVQAVFLAGYKLFRALGEPGRARALLIRAQGLVAARLAAIEGAAARAAFVDRLRVNREIVAACRDEGLALTA